jgi:4-hydroxybutyrate dehydrogenase
MDAVTHCIETFLSPRDNPPAEAIALDGLARGVAHLERAVANGGDLHARKEMMMAALEGGLTFQKGLGAVHSLSHALGALSDLALHHGTLNAVLLPAVLRFNEPAAGEKYERIRRALGLAAGVDLARFIEDLNGRLGLPRNLRAMGVPREALPGVAEAAVADHSTPSNARFVDAAAFEDLLQGAY